MRIVVIVATTITKAISFGALLVTALASPSLPARSQEAAAPYSKMAPVDQYLMTNRSAEIAMARRAAIDFNRCRSHGPRAAWL
jgi:hypothetical protein